MLKSKHRVALPQVSLRVPVAADAAAFYRLFSDPEVMRFIGDGECRSLGWYEEFVERQRRLADELGMCLFTVVHDDEVIGFTGVHPWSPDWGPRGALELGWRLGRRHWGNGYATAAAILAMDIASRRGVSRLISMVHESNTRSRAVARRLRMTEARTHTSPLGQTVIEYEINLRSHLPQA